MFEDNKAIARRFIDEIIHPHNLDVVEEIYASDYVMHNPAAPEEVRGVEGVREFSSMYMNAFLDMEVTVEDQIAEGDKVVTRWTARGTHQGELMGIPPSGTGWRPWGSPSAALKAARSQRIGTYMTP